jgi:hypothetical protein
MKVIFPLYILAWPFMYVLVIAAPISFFTETDFMLFDVRTLFYLIFVACLISRLLNKAERSTWGTVVLMLIWLLGYTFSFIVNSDLESVYRQFNNGFLVFSVAFASTVAFRKLINWDAVVLAYSIAVILFTTLGFLSLFRETGLDLASSYLRSLFTNHRPRLNYRWLPQWVLGVKNGVAACSRASPPRGRHAARTRPTLSSRARSPGAAAPG